MSGHPLARNIPIVICPARSLDRYRIPAAWQTALAQGRLLLLSPFPAAIRRATTETAHRRNEFVARLATEVAVIHANPGGRLAFLVQHLDKPTASVAIAPPRQPAQDQPNPRHNE